MIGIIFLIVYTVVMIVATLIFSKNDGNRDNFYVGNRKMGAVKAAMSIAATWIWAPALFTSAQKAYENGIAGLFWFTVPNLLCLLFFIPFTKKIRREMPEGITLSGYIYSKYKTKSTRNVYLFALSLLSVLSTAVQLLAGGKVMSIATGLPFPLMTIILAAIAYSYSRISGIQASVITDDLQMAMILGVCALFVPMALANGGTIALVKGLGGISGDYTSLFGKKGAEVFFAFGLPTAIGLISGPFGDQCFWQRAFCTDEKKLGKAFGLGALLFAIAPISMGLLGFIAAGSGFIPNSTGTINFELITALFPKWAMVPFMAMLISGLLSTVDSHLAAISSLTTDILDHPTEKTNKASMLILLALGILIANIPGMSVTQLFLLYGTLRAATLLPTMMTLHGTKLYGKDITLGVVLSMAIGLPIFAYGNICNLSAYKTAGCLLTVLLSGLVSFCGAKMRKERTAC